MCLFWDKKGVFATQGSVRYSFIINFGTKPDLPVEMDGFGPSVYDLSGSRRRNVLKNFEYFCYVHDESIYPPNESFLDNGDTLKTPPEAPVEIKYITFPVWAITFPHYWPMSRAIKKQKLNLFFQTLYYFHICMQTRRIFCMPHRLDSSLQTNCSRHSVQNTFFRIFLSVFLFSSVPRHLQCMLSFKFDWFFSPIWSVLKKFGVFQAANLPLRSAHAAHTFTLYTRLHIFCLIYLFVCSWRLLLLTCNRKPVCVFVFVCLIV